MKYRPQNIHIWPRAIFVNLYYAVPHAIYMYLALIESYPVLILICFVHASSLSGQSYIEPTKESSAIDAYTKLILT